MKYVNIKDYSDELFFRHTGISKSSFNEAVTTLYTQYARDHSHNVKHSGRKMKLSMEDRLLATLEYLREYRTYFHIAGSYGVCESSIYRIIKWVEDTLIKSGKYNLPGKKALLEPSIEYEVVLIDATESPIERPKKNRKNTIQERRNDTHSKPN